MTALAGLAAMALAAVHVFASRLRQEQPAPRSRWLSAAGGISVAYVFLHLLPDLVEHQRNIAESMGAGFLGMGEKHVWLFALVGLAGFYGLEKLVASRTRRDDHSKPIRETSGAFWVHTAAFVLYNALIGYLLVRRESQSVQTLLLFTFAIGMHLVVNDYGLHEHHQERYTKVGRWVLSAAVIAGWAMGALGELHEVLIAALFAALAGAIVLNVLKEEVPAERESRFWAFAAGAGGYAAVLLAAG